MKSILNIFKLWAILLPFCLFANSTEKPLSLVESCNKQGLTLLYILPKPQNPLISPFSIYTSLLMAYAGAEGDTAKQLAKALKTNFNQKEAAIAFSKIYDAFSLDSKDSGINFLISNEIWVDKKISILPSFQKIIEKDFYGTIQNIKFSNTEQACATINKSIEKKTDNIIKNFLSENDLSANTKMLLTNTLLLKGPWENPFPTGNTGQKTFLSSNNDKINISMMAQTSVLPYYENKTTQVLSLPIKSSGKSTAFSLVIFLPKTRPSSPFDFYYQDAESPDGFLSYLDLLSAKKIDVAFPKFEIAPKIDISYTLQQLGVTDAFSAQADFSAIDGEKDLSLAKILSQSALNVNEAGIFASASSDISLDIKSTLDPSEPISFNANHPFLFALVEEKSKLIFFIGEFLDPTPIQVQ